MRIASSPKQSLSRVVWRCQYACQIFLPSFSRYTCPLHFTDTVSLNVSQIFAALPQNTQSLGELADCTYIFWLSTGRSHFTLLCLSLEQHSAAYKSLRTLLTLTNARSQIMHYHKAKFSQQILQISYLQNPCKNVSLTHYVVMPGHWCCFRLCLDGHCIKQGVLKASSSSTGGGSTPKANWQLKSS